MYYRNFNCPFCDPYNSFYNQMPYSDYYRAPAPPPPPTGGPGGPGGTGGPSGPPPSFAPSKSQAQGKFKTKSGGPGMYPGPGGIRPCKYKYVYIWLENGKEFWAWLDYVGRCFVAGYRWNGRKWICFGIELDKIDDFQCY